MHLTQGLATTPHPPGPSPARGEGSSSKPMDFFAPWRLCVRICVKGIIALINDRYQMECQVKPLIRRCAPPSPARGEGVRIQPSLPSPLAGEGQGVRGAFHSILQDAV